MQLTAIKQFLHYQPFEESDPQPIVDEIIKLATSYLGSGVTDIIQDTYEYARDAHTDQVRLSGEIYIVHPLRSTLFLMEMKPDIATIQACILHDVIEDTPLTYDDIKATYGQEVAILCQGLVKVSKLKYRGEQRQIETLKKTFLAMAEDLRVIFIKLADRIHNIQTLHYHPKPEKRQRIASETMLIYVPIAKKLGLYRYQILLENGCFAIENPKECARIVSYMDKQFANRSYRTKGIKKLGSILVKGGIDNCSITGRTKSPYRVYQKLISKYQTTDISKVLDIIAFRVIVDDIGECYRALGLIHNSYTPMINKIKDYISLPKSNGYKSLHTTILGLFNFPVEVQIRTQEMDEIAEYGVAAHFVYSDAHDTSSLSDNQARWIKRLQNIVQTYQDLDDKEGFKQELNIEVLDKSKFLYTPKGDVVELPVGGTVLDFAFRIHSDVGLRFKNALVNGIIKPIGFVPATGDVITINTFRNKVSATAYWIDFLSTPSAKNKLQKHLKSQQKNGLIQQSIQKLNDKLKERDLPLIGEEGDLVRPYYSDQERERNLLLALDKQLSYTQFFKDAYPQLWNAFTSPSKEARKDAKQKAATTTIPTHVIIDMDKKLSYTLCETCKPQHQDRIIARSGKDGIKIHSVGCTGIKTVSHKKLLEAHREGTEPTKYKTSLTISMQHQRKHLIYLINIFADLHIAMDTISITNTNDDEGHLVQIESAYSNPAKLAFLFDELKKSRKGFIVKKVVIH